MTRGLACLLLIAALARAPSALAEIDRPLQRFGVGIGREVVIDPTWAQVDLTDRGTRRYALYIDGPQLDFVVVADGLTPGQPIHAGDKDVAYPVCRPDMSLRELMDLVTDTVRAWNYYRVSALHPRPARIGGVDGVRFDLTAQTAEGLDTAGTAEIAQAAGKTYVLIYLAPAEHYFQSRLPDVEKLITALQ